MRIEDIKPLVCMPVVHAANQIHLTCILFILCYNNNTNYYC